MPVRQFVSDKKARLKPCLRCERSLLKHLDDRFCPDCGLSVWMSLNANDALDRSRPEWLSGVAQGAWILALAQPIGLAAYLIAFFGHELPTWRDGILADTDPIDRDSMGPAATGPAGDELLAVADVDAFDAARETARLAMIEPSVPVAIALALVGLFFVLSAIGLARLTVDERRYPDRVRTSRVAARIIAGIALLVGIVSLGAGLAHLGSGFPAHTGIAWLTLIGIELTFAAVACVGWLYLRPIARRGSRSGLARLSGYLLFLPLLAFAKAAPFIGIWFLFLLMPLATLLPLAYLPLSTVLLVKYARLMQRAAPAAHEAWAAESRPAESQLTTA